MEDHAHDGGIALRALSLDIAQMPTMEEKPSDGSIELQAPVLLDHEAFGALLNEY